MSGHFGTVVLFFICLILPHGMDNLKRKEADVDLTSKVGFSFHNNIKRPPLLMEDVVSQDRMSDETVAMKQ